ncbi:MAG: fibronectin type III domain-containing protein [Pseudomonadota bacterium]
MRRSVRTWLVAGLAILVLASCGVKGPPLPADALLPGPVRDVAYSFNEEGLLVVEFKAPLLDARGVKIDRVDGFFVDRSENDLTQGFCPGCPVRYTSRFQVNIEPPLEGESKEEEEKFKFVERLNPDHSYRYRIFAHDDDGEFDPASFVSLVVNYDSPIRPPDDVRVETGDAMILVSWTPPDRLVDGRPLADLAGYDIHRREEGRPWTRLNVDRAWDRTVYRDSRAEKGRTYDYKIRSVRLWRETRIEGPPSRMVSAAALDLTPPPPPVNVNFASTDAGVSLSWSEAEAGDLAGYRVYRRAEGESDFQVIGPKIILKNLFVDKNVVPGRKYYYRMTAVDNSPAANESEPTREIEATYAP